VLSLCAFIIAHFVEFVKSFFYFFQSFFCGALFLLPSPDTYIIATLEAFVKNFFEIFESFFVVSKR
jgi:hypothetical protein